MAGTMNKLIDKAVNAKRESKYVDFKERFDPSSNGDWCEVIKDMIAMANSGGGVILIGVNNDGSPSGYDPAPVLHLDDAAIPDKVRKYVRRDFADFEIVPLTRDGTAVAGIVVGAARRPFVFEAPGTYDPGNGKQKTAFGQGTVYFRHGAKSEPGTNEDLENALERALAGVRKDWLRGVRKVVEAPPGSEVAIIKPGGSGHVTGAGTPVRLVDDPKAPEYRLVKPDEDFPYRLKELVSRISVKLPPGVTVTRHDVLALRRVHLLDEDPGLVYKPKFGSPQYSEACADWIVTRVQQDPQFLDAARQAYRDGHVSSK